MSSRSAAEARLRQLASSNVIEKMRVAYEEQIKKCYGLLVGQYYKEKLMIKEMTVSEIARALGHEVKVVKEQPLNIPRDIYVGQVYQVNDDKYMVAALGNKGVGLTSVGGCAGCWSSNLIEGSVSSDEVRNRLVKSRAKFLGTFGSVFKRIK